MARSTTTVIGIVASFCFVLLTLGNQVHGSCIDPTSCFCQITPHDIDYLIKAEVTGLDYPMVWVDLIPEEIFKTPTNSEAELLVGEEYAVNNNISSKSLVLGDVGIFIVRYSNYDRWELKGYFRQEEGLYPCYMAPDYEGATESQLVNVLTSRDCYSAARSLGIDISCNDQEGCECPPSDSTTGAKRGSVLLVVVMVIGLAIRRS